MDTIEFKQRWREELEAISAEGKLIFECTIGQKHVYFPDEGRWLALAPDWARDKWRIYLESCQRWCRQNRIPITTVADANFYPEKLA